MKLYKKAQSHIAQKPSIIHLKPVAIAIALAMSSVAFAEDTNTVDVGNVSKTANPLGVSSDEMVTPVTVINGRELTLRRSSTLGELLNGTPGVSANSFGPNASRPVIRGLDSERVRILQNGVGILDVSSLSFDHAVGVDPLIVEQIDVVRGPAALLYGGSAVGGVVNAIDHRIPKEQLDGVLGRAEARFGGPADTRSAVGVLDFGNELFAVHVDGYNRETNNLDIPGFAVTRERAAIDDEAEQTDKGELINSDAQQDGASFGASLTFDNGYIGASYAVTNNNYGTTGAHEHGGELELVRIDLDSERFDIASEFTNLSGFIDRTKVKLAHTDYNHAEFEGDELGTTFDTDGWQGTFELGHRPIGNLTGVVGYQFIDSDFSAVGEEAFVPGSNTKSKALYVYEEMPINQHKITFGARFGRDEVDAETGINKSFTPNSFAVGGIYQLNSAWSIAANLSHNERAPSHFELFADGLHVATEQIEQGDVTLDEEKSNGIDAQLRWSQGANSFSVSAYATRFNDFIALRNTGLTDTIDGETFDIHAFEAVSASFTGVEFQGQWQASNTLALNVRGDYVRARDRSNSDSLPRISPARLGAGANYTKGNFNLRLDVLHAFKQNKTAVGELDTDSYTNVTAIAAYKLPVSHFNVELFAKANNLLDDEIRDHASFLKDTTPAGERSLTIGARADF